MAKGLMANMKREREREKTEFQFSGEFPSLICTSDDLADRERILKRERKRNERMK